MENDNGISGFSLDPTQLYNCMVFVKQCRLAGLDNPDQIIQKVRIKFKDILQKFTDKDITEQIYHPAIAEQETARKNIESAKLKLKQILERAKMTPEERNAEIDKEITLINGKIENLKKDLQILQSGISKDTLNRAIRSFENQIRKSKQDKEPQ